MKLSLQKGMARNKKTILFSPISTNIMNKTKYTFIKLNKKLKNSALKDHSPSNKLLMLGYCRS
jgi:hypothetical protein